MPHRTVFHPPDSRPSRAALDADLAGRWFQVCHQGVLVFVADSRALPGGEPEATEAALAEALARTCTGGPLEEFEHEDLTVWRGGQLRAVVHGAASFTVHAPPEPKCPDSPARLHAIVFHHPDPEGPARPGAAAGDGEGP